MNRDSGESLVSKPATRNVQLHINSQIWAIDFIVKKKLKPIVFAVLDV